MTAIQIPATGHWVGNTGPWSTFAIQIGNDSSAPTVEVVPATSKSNIWPVLSDWCERMPMNSTECATFRGGFFYPESSDAFHRIQGKDTYVNLPFDAESPLGYSGNAIAGTDFIVLESSNSVPVLVGEQALTAFAYTSPFIAAGLIGLSNQTLYILDENDGHLSLLSTLRENGQIPSLFWGYNAGALYVDPNAVYASLTLGGYDAGRGGELKDALVLPMQANDDRDLVVSLEAVAIGDGGTNKVTPAINLFIDSVVPDLWLPESVCRIFEDAFGLQWNDTAQLYLLDEAQTSRLFSDKNARVNFTLADPSNSNNSINIAVSYPAFDRLARYPLAGIQDDSGVQYFPLKRASDPSQYYLGHAFLQEA